MGKLTDFFSKASEPDQPSQGGSTPDSDLDSVRSELSKNRRRLGKAERHAVESQLAAELDKLYTPENWEALATFYPDVRYVVTGDDIFIPTERERAACAVSLATVARLLIKLDPAYIALVLFAANETKMITRMEMAYKTKARRKVAQTRIGASG